MSGSSFPVISALDALTGALFLLTALGVVATRQVLASLQLFIAQSLLLTASALLLSIALRSPHLLAVAVITIATKTLLIPWLLKRTVSAEVYRTREIDRVLNIPSSLLLSAVFVLVAYAVANPLLEAVSMPFARINLPLGIAARAMKGRRHGACGHPSHSGGRQPAIAGADWPSARRASHADRGGGRVRSCRACGG